MTAESPPYVVQGGSHGATLFRQAICTLQGNRSGVIGIGDLKVTALGSPGMAINVAGGVPGGQAWIKGTTAEGSQSSYYGFNSATQEIAVVAAGSEARIDSPIAQVKDAQYAGVENTYTLSIVKGVESGAPVEPSLPASSMQLAAVKVAAKVTKIENANITDKRVILGTGDSFLKGTAAERPAAGVEGRIYFATDTKLWSLDSGSAWETTAGPESVGTANLAAKSVTDAKVQAGRALVETENAYGALTAITEGKEEEPSSTRLVQVILEVNVILNKAGSFKVKVGGVTLPEVKFLEPGTSTEQSVGYPSFLVPPGKKWKWEGVHIATVKASYLQL